MTGKELVILIKKVEGANPPGVANGMLAMTIDRLLKEGWKIEPPAAPKAQKRPPGLGPAFDAAFPQ